MKDRTTIRVSKGKEHVLEEFQDIVKNRLHSDQCYVTTELYEAFIKAIKQLPSEPMDSVEMKFFKQNIQINLGCNFYYDVKKARRAPPEINLDKNRFFPLLLEEWPTMNEEAKDFMRTRLKEAGIIETHPSVSSGTQKNLIKKIWASMEESMTKGIRALKKYGLLLLKRLKRC